MTASGVKPNGHDFNHQRHFDASAEDAALEFERSMLESPAPKPKKKSSESKKRPVPSLESDIEVEPGRDKSTADTSGPSTKKRKLVDGALPVGNGVDAETVQEPLKLSIPKLKGRGKANQRETSQDSVSVTPKVRKKPGPKKKTGLALEDDEQGSRPASLLGDVTPAVSRPTSPVPTNTSMVYELDEHVPPMKKAKKVDDAVMVKRIKSLEEAQRKVWTNIARREVAKVSSSCCHLRSKVFTDIYLL